MSERKYRDSNGVEMSLGRLVVAEPEWAANQIRKAIGNEDRIAELEIRLAAEKESVGGCAVVVAKQKARIALLEAENQRYRDRLSQLETEIKALREASTKVLLALLPGKIVHMGHEHVRYSATYSIVGWNPILSLAALLGGGG